MSSDEQWTAVLAMARAVATPLVFHQVTKRLTRCAICALLGTMLAGFFWSGTGLMAYLALRGIGHDDGLFIAKALGITGAFCAGFSYDYWRRLWRGPVPTSLPRQIGEAFLKGWQAEA